MTIPPKPKRGKRSPFYWWRRWKSHKYLPVRAGLLARIQNGDFDYPDQFEWAEYELHYMQDELDEFIKEYQGNDPKEDMRYYDIQKRYMKRYNKLREDANEVEQRHLTGLVDGLFNEFILSKDAIREIMEEFGGTAEELYHYIEKLQVGVRSDSDAKQLERLRRKYGL
tara:strand:+ start:307 stop:810 length:504 start_codon:yes stop_codon:yes gene_type:complete